MAKQLQSLAALALLACLLGEAHAALPRYAPGEVFIYDNGRVEQVRAAESGKVTWAARSGRSYVRSANPVVPILEWSYRGQVGTRKVLGAPDKLWPLRTGASVQFRTLNEARIEGKSGARRSIHLWTCSVKAREKVTTPAGRFEAFPIVCDRFSAGSMKVIERITWHFAPEVGHYVRREARDLRDGQRDVFSLYAAIPPREANPLRIETLARQAQRGAKLAAGE